MTRDGVQILGLPWTTRLNLARIRAGNRLFCWVARHAPRVAQVWVLRRWP